MPQERVETSDRMSLQSHSLEVQTTCPPSHLQEVYLVRDTVLEPHLGDLKPGFTRSWNRAWDLSNLRRPETVKNTCPAVDIPGEPHSSPKAVWELTLEEHPREAPCRTMQLPQEWEYQLNLSRPGVGMQSRVDGDPRRSLDTSRALCCSVSK